jgi:hypothetical protein
MAKPLLLFLIEFTCNKMLQGKDWYIGGKAKKKMKNEKQEEDGERKSKRRVQIAVVV